MRFQERDAQILRAIYEYDGVLARRHLKEMFWPGASLRAVQRRLSKLFQEGYLARPAKHQWRTKPISEPIYWLGWKGAIWIAGQNGVEAEIPANDGENQMRKLHRYLREHGMRWTREPRWDQLRHDLIVVDFRLAVEQATNKIPSLILEEWIPEGVFLSNMDVVEYEIKGKGGEVKGEKKGVRPDGYFVILDDQRLAQGLPARARFLLEVDHSTYDNPRFGRDKVIPGVAYVKSPEYKTRFGDNSGRWLVVTTGQRRMANVKRQAEIVAGRGANIFYFTTFDKVKPESLLTSPIWYRGGDEHPSHLFRP